MQQMNLDLYLLKGTVLLFCFILSDWSKLSMEGLKFQYSEHLFLSKRLVSFNMVKKLRILNIKSDKWWVW